MQACDTHLGWRLERYVAEQLRLASAAFELSGRESRRGVHHGRKAVRRARAALLLGWEHPNAAVVFAVEQLKRTNAELSELRDAHALVEAAKHLAGRASGHARDVLDHAHKRLKRARKSLEGGPPAHARLRAARDRVAFIASGVAVLPWDEVADGGMRAVLATTGAQVARAQHAAMAHGSPAKLHRWRRRLRRLLQQHDACVALGVDMPADTFSACVAEQLGKLQDDNVLLAEGPRLAGLQGTPKKRLRQAAREARNLQRERLMSVLRR